MGKRYYCDYCDKTMSCAPSIIRTHNSGLLHQQAKQEHYQKFKDPETILAEESQKKLCAKFPNGQCMYGSLCRFSHYSPEALQYLRNYVSTRKLANAVETQPCFQDLYNRLQTDKSIPSNNDTTILVDKNGVSHTLPWTYNEVLNRFGENIPPSIRPISVEDFTNVSFEFHLHLGSGISAPSSKLRLLDEAKFVDRDFTDYDEETSLLGFKRKTPVESFNDDVKAKLTTNEQVTSNYDNSNSQVTINIDYVDSNKIEYSYDEDDELLLPRLFNGEDLLRQRKKRHANILTKSAVENLTNDTKNLTESTAIKQGDSKNKEISTEVKDNDSFVQISRRKGDNLLGIDLNLPRQVNNSNKINNNTHTLKSKNSTSINNNIGNVTQNTKVTKSESKNKVMSRILDNDTKVLISRRKLKMSAADRARFSLAKAKKLERRRVKERYQEKIKEIMNFLLPNYMTTNFLYDEMNRIQKHGERGDKLLMLIEYLERPELDKLRTSVLKCFWDEAAKMKPPPADILKGKIPNNLAIDPIKDPYLYE